MTQRSWGHSLVDYRRAFTAVRMDPQWKRKLALGMVIQLIPYVGTVWLIGWQMQYQRNVVWGHDTTIPEWSGFAEQAMLGLKAVVAALPYSLAYLVAVLPTSMIASMMLVSGAESGTAPPWPAIAALSVGAFVLPLAIALLLTPLSSSTMLRVALYGTFESGFQYKEIFRLMRERRSELLRAWGFSVVNSLISMGVMAVFLGLAVLLAFLLPGVWEDKIIAVLVLTTGAYFVYMVLALALSVYLGLVNMHLFGSYGRIAYRIDEVRESAAIEPSSVSTR